MSKAVLNTIVRTFTLAALVSSSSLSSRANERHDPRSGNFPNLNLPQNAQGEEAIASLGDQLPAVAQSYGHQPDELRNLFRSDPRLHVDRTGRLFYVDEGLPEDAVEQTQQNLVVAGAAPYPLANTFLLHSRPGAPRVIFLDFDGHVLTGTAWNNTYSTINASPWDIDGNPSSFGDAERTTIQGIWQRVAEDYAPFDVDVTTEYKGESVMTRSDLNDQYFGTRVLISAISSYFGRYGGIAYVGAYDYTSDYYKPALVFPENLGNNEKYIAEAISHEAGHNLGLNHDGTTTGSAYYTGSGSGETGWAPIMGIGYYQTLSQWSKGEYTSANNKEDDFLVIQSNGLFYRPDDHGNTSATATMLPAGSLLSASGVIERSTDVDVFAFTTGAGTISINVNRALTGPNLDLLLQLYNSSGLLVSSVNPTGVLNASLNLAVASGTYYLWVRGTGQGDPSTGYSSYGSLGVYTLTGTLPTSAGNLPPLAVAGASPVSGYAPLNVQFNGGQSSDPDGTITAYLWTFGDGTTSTSAAILHTYSSAGTYFASLKVTDNGGLSATSTVTIVVNPPIVTNISPTAVASASVVSGNAPLLVYFTGSNSSDSDGFISLYYWTFGDGTTAAVANPQHTYSSAGTYFATLRVTDNGGASATKTITILVNPPIATNLLPTALASATPSTGSAPLPVSFTGSSSYDADGFIASYYWTFGDGTTAAVANPQHSYLSAGTYFASLRVTDNGGASATKTITILVNPPIATNVLPTAIASASPVSGSAPLVVSFIGSNSYDADGSISLYRWSFGDGTSADGANVTHTYQAGSYFAVLTVTDNNGASSSSSSLSISAQGVSSTSMRVSSISLVSRFWSAWGNVTATVTVLDSSGRAVPGATVAANWSGAVAGTATGTTSTSGQVTFTSGNIKKDGGTVTFRVSNVTKSGYTYDAANSVTSRSIVP